MVMKWATHLQRTAVLQPTQTYWHHPNRYTNNTRHSYVPKYQSVTVQIGNTVIMSSTYYIHKISIILTSCSNVSFCTESSQNMSVTRLYLKVCNKFIYILKSVSNEDNNVYRVNTLYTITSILHKNNAYRRTTKTAITHNLLTVQCAAVSHSCAQHSEREIYIDCYDHNVNPASPV